MFENDKKLREAGFKIYSREKDKPAFWERGHGENKRVYEEKNAFVIMEEESSKKKKIKSEPLEEKEKKDDKKPKKRKRPFGYS